MRRHLIATLILPAALLVASRAEATHFAIDLAVQAGKARKTAETDTAGLGQRPKPRAVLQVKAGDRVTVTWTLRNTDTTATYKNVVVHFFVVKERKLGLETIPKLNKGVVVESAQSIDFKPKDQTKGELSFTIDQAGSYLLRLETIGAAVGKDGHEHFAALDIQVQ